MTYAQDLAKLGISTGILGDQDTLEFLRKTIRLPEQASILDIGCQGGELSIQLADLFEAEVTGIDNEPSSVELAKANAKRSTYLGRVKFNVSEIVSANSLPENGFDLVIHRGLEAFIKDKKAFHLKVASLAKRWGYVANISHTYEGQYDKSIIEKLNKAGSMFIEPVSRAELIQNYKAVGLRLVGEFYFEVAPSAALDLGVSAAAKRVTEVLSLSVENDKYTSGAVLIFRSQPSILVSDACKG